MYPRDIEDYGGIFADKFAVEDPTVEQAATYHNRLAEDVVQMTRVTPRGMVKFTGTNSTGAVSVSSPNVFTVWGTGSSYAPTVAKTATTGEYTLTWSASYADAVDETETVSVFAVQAAAQNTTTAYHIQGTGASNVVTLKCFTAGGSADNLNGVTIVVWIW